MSKDVNTVVGIGDGASVDIGGRSDAAVPDPANPSSIIGALKGILSVLQGGGALENNVDLVKYNNVAVGAGNALHMQPGTAAVFPVNDNGGSLSIDIGGIVPGLDDTNKLKTSLYGKNTASGDTEISVDASGNVQTDLVAAIPAGSNIIGQVGVDQTSPGTTNGVRVNGASALYQGIVNVTTAGTRVQFGSQACQEVTIIAKRGNTGYIYVGNASVSSSDYGVELAAKDSITLPVNNLNLVWIDSSVNGEGVSYVAV